MSRAGRVWMTWAASLAMAWPGAAGAVKYMSVEEAVKTFLPAPAKIFKTSKQVTDAQRAQIVQDYGWQPAGDPYVFYLGRDEGGAPTGYVVLVPELFNTCFHKYAVGMRPSGEIIETVVVELSCPRATPINRKTFLRQFRGKRHVDALTTRLDIDAVTGATLSSEATAQAARKAVSLHHVFFGNGERIKVSEDVRAARTAGAGAIQKAIDSGETLWREGQPPAESADLKPAGSQ